jgi:hypothetical protein
MWLEPMLARVGGAVRDDLREAAAALRGQRGPPSLEAVDLALDDCAAEMAAFRREGLTRDLPTDEVERIFVLGFALEHLRQHLDDLNRCVKECAQSGIGDRLKAPRSDRKHVVRCRGR